MNISIKKITLVAVFAALGFAASAQKYQVVDKIVAVVGNEMISLSSLEEQVQMLTAQGMLNTRNARCEVLEQILESKLFLMQARLDSLSVNEDMVEAALSQHVDGIRRTFGSDEKVEEYFRKPLYKLRQNWRQQVTEQNLTQQEQSQIAGRIPEVTPGDVKHYIDTVDKADLPVVPVKYQLSQICIYPDREAANFAVREKLLELRERIMNGEKFTTLARIYSEDPGTALRGGELGMAPKSMYWPVFSDAAMSLKPGNISQIVETPDGFHIIEVIDKKGDMFNARHILMKPKYTDEDREKAFKTLDSLRTEIQAKAVSFELAAAFYSQDLATRTNGGQMADPSTGSSYFEIDQLKPEDYRAIKDLKEGEISEPVQSLDNEGRNGNTVYKVIKVDKIIPAHTASFTDDYTQLQEKVQQDLRIKELDKFIDEHIKTTHIILDPMFSGCEFNRSAWLSKIRK
ncbi:MAG: peptidylprolyl isomerase [Bacteroidales bacterium]|nr:peptidylprolyl isomerase [Bacteroidales bacterium]